MSKVYIYFNMKKETARQVPILRMKVMSYKITYTLQEKYVSKITLYHVVLTASNKTEIIWKNSIVFLLKCLFCLTSPFSGY